MTTPAPTPEAQANALARARCDHDDGYDFCDYCQDTADLIAQALATARGREEALEEALAEMGNAMEAGAYDAAWTIRNAALAHPTPTPPAGEQG